MGRGSDCSAIKTGCARARQQRCAPGGHGLCAQPGQPCHRERRAGRHQHCCRRRPGPRGPQTHRRRRHPNRAPAAAHLPSAGALATAWCITALSGWLCLPRCAARSTINLSVELLWHGVQDLYIERCCAERVEPICACIHHAGALVQWLGLCHDGAAQSAQGAADIRGRSCTRV